MAKGIECLRQVKNYNNVYFNQTQQNLGENQTEQSLRYGTSTNGCEFENTFSKILE